LYRGLCNQFWHWGCRDCGSWGLNEGGFDVVDGEIINRNNLWGRICRSFQIHSWELDRIVDSIVNDWVLVERYVIVVVNIVVDHSWDVIIPDEPTVSVGECQ
jgi:hypothetical protein